MIGMETLQLTHLHLELYENQYLKHLHKQHDEENFDCKYQLPIYQNLQRILYRNLNVDSDDQDK